MRAAIYKDNNCGSAIGGFSVDSVECIDESRIIGAPVETGAISFDNKVIDPYTVVVTGHIVDAFGDYENNSPGEAKNDIYEMFLNRDFKFYSVSDNADEYVDLILERVRQTKSASHPDWKSYELRYKQAMLIQKSFESANMSPRNAENSNTRSTGVAAVKR